MKTSKSPEWNTVIIDLTERGFIKSNKVKNIMLNVDRKNFVPYLCDPYCDSALPIGFGATISAPHIHATILELLKDNLSPGAKALDVGSGSGYVSACMGFMVGPTGLVVTIDHISNLLEMSKQNILKGNSVLFGWESMIFVEADGRLGYPNSAPYDVINVGVATQNIPMILLEQLAPGGRLVIPVGGLRSYQFLMQVDKQPDGNISKKRIRAVKFDPLTDRTTQKRLSSQITLDISIGH